MKQNPLGKSGINVSAMTIGCWPFGGGTYWGAQAQADVDRVVHAALDLGVNAFDTAEMYNGGASETSLGLALKGSRRDKAVVISKISPSNCAEGNVRKHCVASLQRLGMDYLDVYMLHWPINKLALEHFTKDSATLAAPPTIQSAYAQLAELQREGLVRSIGMSNFGAGQMAEVVATGVRVDVNEMPFNVVSRAIEPVIAPYCLKHDIAIIGSMGLQQGLLAGIYEDADSVPPPQAHSRHFAHWRGDWAQWVARHPGYPNAGTGNETRHGENGCEAETFATVSGLRDIARRLNITIAQLSIAWILKKPFMASTLVGSRNTDELRQNIDACAIEISDEIVAEIDALSQPVLDALGANPDYYEANEKSRIF
ncbi:MAG: aldo/keto reductase [Puniceicoccales bacterium]|jgi:aryl-alcohol dehydrogenase-like predicted oxidoreductase|nr:aldo/keto reductase [Puniceicoccales bacterium]